MHYLYIDIETRSDLDVRDVGAFVYGAHPSTEILCIASALGDAPVRVDTTLTATLARILRPGVVLVAHNVDFERNVLEKYIPGIKALPWLDTAALAARMSLPRKLEELALALYPDRPEYHKDMAGNRTMLKLTKRNRRGEWWTPETVPEDFEKLYAYCAKDVEVMRACHRMLLPLEESEQAIWALTQEMNEDGVALDVASLEPARAFLARHTAAQRARFVELTGLNPRSPVKVAEHFGLPSADKIQVREALRNPAMAEHHEALRLLQQLNASAVSKIDAMANRVSADGRLRGAFTYCGAERTGRWSSIGVQLQNIARGLGESTETAFQALHSGTLELAFDGTPQDHPAPALTPITTLSGMVRGFLLGDPDLLVGDFAQIEARDLASLAGQTDLLQVFAEKGDPYSRMASRIYGREVTKKDKAERFMGKQTVLGCGYGMGRVRFKAMLAEIYDVQIDADFAKRVVNTYRATHPKITALWATLQNGFRAVIGGGMKKVKVGPVFMGTLTHQGLPWAWIEIRSGRRLWYFKPHLKGRAIRYSESHLSDVAGVRQVHPQLEGTDIRYFGREPGRGWGTIHTHGGKIAENIVQAESRDVMAEAMLRLRAAGFHLRGTVHDEVLCADAPERLPEFTRLLSQRPAWAPDLPIDVEVFTTRRYRK